MLIDDIKLIMKNWLQNPDDNYLEQFYNLVKKMVKAIIYKNYLNRFESDGNIEMFAHDCATNLTINFKTGKLKKLNSKYLNLYIMGFIKLYENTCKNTPVELDDNIGIQNFGYISDDYERVFYNELLDSVFRDIKRIGKVIGFEGTVFCSYILLSKILNISFKRSKKIKNEGFWFLFNVCDSLMDFIGYDEKIWYKDVLKYSLIKRNNKLLKLVLYAIKYKSGIEFFLNDFCKKDILLYKTAPIKNRILDKINVL